jgi:hypothetical protein
MQIYQLNPMGPYYAGQDKIYDREDRPPVFNSLKTIVS